MLPFACVLCLSVLARDWDSVEAPRNQVSSSVVKFDEIDETGAISHEIARRSPLDGMSRHQMSQELTIHSHYLERPHTEAATSLNDRQLPWPSAKSGTLARTRRPSFFWAAITSDRGIS